MARAFLDGYAQVRALPDARTPRWYAAAALLAERGLRTVNRIRPEALARLVDVVGRRPRPARWKERTVTRPTSPIRPDQPKVLCSLRDILVGGRVHQAKHDERASRRVDAYFDGVLVHSDPTFARLADSFHPATPLRVPVHHTGFVAPPTGASAVRPQRRLIVSSGGGTVGEPPVRAAVDVHTSLEAATGLTTTVVAGPFLPEPVWTWLQGEAERSPALTAIRQVPDLAHEIRCSALSLSQRLLAELLGALELRPQALSPDLDGAGATARILGNLVGGRPAPQPREPALGRAG